MQIVIDIPCGLKDAFEHEREWTALLCADMREVLRNGTILPKGHGRLIDGDALFFCMTNGVDQAIAEEARDDAPTIIEADKGEWVSHEIHY